MSVDTYKQAKTKRDYKTTFKGWELTVPAGSIVCNRTSRGPDDQYHFWLDFSEQAEKISGVKNSPLERDLNYYGLNIPAEFCEPY